MSFTASGTQLASVSTAPDFLLTVWDWENEAIALHTKAFGQDVYSVKFSLDDERRLTTSGTGHIRFWKMASTFTGLKLQGNIGKFGKVDLSDIASFIELPDGKVVSGTETGAILLWEGNFIKCRFVRADPNSPRSNESASPRSRYPRSPRSNKIMCHFGEINYIDLDRDERCIITAGEDGYIRWWDFDVIGIEYYDKLRYQIYYYYCYYYYLYFMYSYVDEAEVDTDITMDYEILPKAEYYLGPDRGIKTVVDSGKIGGDLRYFIILDKTSAINILKFSVKGNKELVDMIIEGNVPEIENLGGFHSGSISCMDCCPIRSNLATCGADGSVKLFDYQNRKLLSQRKFNSPATFVRWVPSYIDPSSSYIIAGYNDGVIRTFSSKTSSLSLTNTIKPHNSPVTCLAFSEISKTLATAGKDGAIWFFDYSFFNDNHQVDILRFITPFPSSDEMKKNIIYCESLSWDSTGNYLLCSCSDYVLREVDVSELIRDRDVLPTHFDSYKITLPIKECPIKLQVLNQMASKQTHGSPIRDAKPEAFESTSEDATVDMPSPKEEIALSYSLVNLKVYNAKYLVSEEGKKKVIASCKSSDRNINCEYTLEDENSLVELKCGLNSSDGKDYSKAPLANFIDRNISGNYFLMGTEEGSVCLRSNNFIQTFVRFVPHQTSITSVAISFDDKYLFTTGKDGILVICAIKNAEIKVASKSLWLDLDAGVFGDTIIKPETKDSSKETSVLTIKSKLTPSALLSPSEPSIDETVDISPSAYSIEDKKLKTGHEELIANAEDKKNNTRRLIKNLQMDYEQLLKKNDLIPEVARLSPEELVVDPDLIKLLSEEGDHQIEEVRKLCAYENEKALKLKEKLYNKLLEGVLFERIPLSALSFPDPLGGKESSKIPTVYSLRTRSMDSVIEEVLNSVRIQEKKNAILAAKEKANNLLKSNSEASVLEVKNRLENEDVSLHEGSQVSNDKSLPRGTSSAARKELRLERKKKIAEHLSLKPKEDDDDARDIHAIKFAEDNLGDYKTKSSDDYRVKVGEEVNVEKKKRQLVLLEESLTVLRLKFNEKFLALRCIKKDLILNIQSDNQRLREIDRELQKHDRSANLWEPKLSFLEFPDDRDEVTELELMAFKRARENTPWIKALVLPNSTITGNKTSIAVDLISGEYNIIKRDNLPPETKSSEERKDISEYDQKKFYEVDDNLFVNFSIDSSKNLSSLESCLPSLNFAKNNIKNLIVNANKYSNLSNVINERSLKLEFEREMIIKNMETNVNNFYRAIETLRKLRHETTANIKLAELKLLVLFQEYELLQTFESKDLALQAKRYKCQKEKNEILSNLQDFTSKMDSKVGESKDWQVKLAAIQSEMETLVPSNHQYFDILSRIYKKKVKVNKSNENEDDEDEEEEEDEEEDDEDGVEVEDICPPGCDKSLYEKVIRLRESRAENEEQLNLVLKSIDELKRSIDRQKQKEKQIDKDAKQTEAEIQSFQTTKQSAMNQIEVFVPLNISQIFPFERSGSLSGPVSKRSEDEENEIQILLNAELRELVKNMSMKSHVLFQRESLNKLQARIGELEEEIESAKNNFKALHKQKVLIEKNIKIRNTEISDKKAKVLSVQMMKFGKEIDIDELEQKSDRSWEYEIEDGITSLEEKFRTQQLLLEKEQDALTDKLIEVILNTFPHMYKYTK